MSRITGFCIMDDRKNCFLIPNVIKIKSILRSDHQLCGYKLLIYTVIDILRIFNQIIYSGKIQLHLPIIFNSCSRKTPTSVICFTWIQRYSLIFPAYKIFADNMTPVHSSPLRCIRKALIEQMIQTFEINKTIRVIHPAVFWFYIYFLHYHILFPILQYIYELSAELFLLRLPVHEFLH